MKYVIKKIVDAEDVDDALDKEVDAPVVEVVLAKNDTTELTPAISCGPIGYGRDDYEDDEY